MSAIWRCALLLGAVLTAEMERQEDLAESLSGDLASLATALTQRDLRALEGQLAADFSGPAFPGTTVVSGSSMRWLSTHGWQRAPPSASGRAAFVSGLQSFLAHLPTIEDARFELTEAAFGATGSDTTGQGRVSFAVVGRDARGRREWTRGDAKIAVRRTGPRWRFTSFDVGALESQVSARDMFSDVSIPSGVVLPPRTMMVPASLGEAHGAAAGDLDGDGWIDALVTSREGTKAFVNEGGRRFRLLGAEAGLPGTESLVPGRRGPTGVLLLDYDNDGDSDVFLAAVGRQTLLENRFVPDGRLQFRDVSEASGVALEALGYSAAAADVDGDGLTDIYVACYNDFGRTVPDSWLSALNGTPNLFFRNLGGGRFREEAARWGIADARWSYAAAFADVDGDGRQDLYVANDFGENGLFMNRGDRFVDEARQRGALDPAAGMGVSFGDYNRDGQIDLHVTNMSSLVGRRILGRLGNPPPRERTGVPLAKLAAGNTLLAGVAGGRFRDVTAETGPFEAGWAWGGGFVDLDNDGWDDIVVPNGYVSGRSRQDTQGYLWRAVAASAEEALFPGPNPLAEQSRLLLQGQSYNGYERDRVYINLEGKRFLDVSGTSGLDSATDGRGAVFADFDNDGDADVLLTTRRGPGVLLFRNELGPGARWLRVVLQAEPKAARDGFGAVVRVRTLDGTQMRLAAGGMGFLSQHDPRLLFGLGTRPRAEGVEVTWPGGVRESFAGDFSGGRTLRLVQGTGQAQPIVVPASALPDPPSRAERLAHARRVRAGQRVPPLVLTAPDGQVSVVTGLLRPSRRLWLLVWATWCGTCRDELVELQRIATPLAERGVDTALLNVDLDASADVAGFLREAGITLPSFTGRLPALEHLYSSEDVTMPMALLMDADGTVSEVWSSSDGARKRLRALSGS